MARHDSNPQEAVVELGDSEDSTRTFRAKDKDAAIVETVRMLADSLSPWAVTQWFEVENRYLEGRRSVDLLIAGQHDRVREATRAFIEGTYL